MTFGQILKHYRKAAGLTQIQLGEKLYKSAQVISNWERGYTTGMTMEDIRNIAGVLRIPPDLLFGSEIPQSVESEPFRGRPSALPPQSRGKAIPVLGSIAAGIPIEAIEDVLDWEEIPADWLRGGAEYFALKIKGSSMEPRIFDGDVVIVKKQPTVESGQIAAVLINGEDATIKKLKITPDGIMLIGLNPSVFEPRFYSNAEVQSLPLTVLGLVVEVRGKLA